MIPPSVGNPHGLSAPATLPLFGNSRHVGRAGPGARRLRGLEWTWERNAGTPTGLATPSNTEMRLADVGYHGRTIGRPTKEYQAFRGRTDRLLSRSRIQRENVA